MLLLTELLAKNNLSQMITKKFFPRNVDINGVIGKKGFLRSWNDFSHVITKFRPFPRNVDINRIMSKKQFVADDHKKSAFLEMLILTELLAKKDF